MDASEKAQYCCIGLLTVQSILDDSIAISTLLHCLKVKIIPINLLELFGCGLFGCRR